MSGLRGVWLLTVTGLGLMAGLARAEDFEAGKSAAKIFESDCVTCHRSPRGLAKGMGARALTDFLREHYTTGLGPANELANYLQSGTTDGDNRHAPRSAGEQPRAGDQHERSQTAAPSDADATDADGPTRKHRHAASTPESAAASDHDATPSTHRRHHARTTEPTNDAEPPANAPSSPPASTQAPSDADATDADGPTRKHRHAASTPESAAASEHDATPSTHRRHHARTTEPTNDAEPPANAPSSQPTSIQAAPDETPPRVLPTRESRRKHQRSPRGAEPSQSAKQRPDMTPTGAAGQGTGTSESSQAGTGAGKEPASAAARGAETDGAPTVPAHANREGAAQAGEPAANPGPASPVTSETGGAHTSEPPSATASSDQPAFSAPSP